MDINSARAAETTEGGLEKLAELLNWRDSKLFIFEQLELTTIDLLRKVVRPEEPQTQKEVLTEEERERLLASYDLDTFEDVRDRAIMATFMATGMRRTASTLK